MSESQDPFVGQSFHGHVMERLLGRGAMGAVYLGKNESTGTRVAFKFLSAEYAMREEFVTRFTNEANLCAALEHDNIIRLYEAGHEEDLRFMMMEYVDGQDLGQILESQAKIKESKALPWLKAVALALSYAHSRGIIHRDLKPENIMLTRQGQVKLADLGLSKNIGLEQEASMTMSGTVIGTPYYISPEQARDAKHVDGRTDVYSLGATFYHLLTGAPPFEGKSSAEIMAKHMHEQLVLPQRKNTTLSDGLGDLIFKMMAKDPENRFQTMDELAAAIERLERGEKVLSNKVRLRRDSPADEEVVHAQPKMRLRPQVVVILVILALLGMGALYSKISGPAKKREIGKPAATASQTDKPRAVENMPPPVAPPVGKVESATAVEEPAQMKTGTVTETTAEPGEIVYGETKSSIPSVMTGSGPNWFDAIIVIGCLLGVPLAKQVGVMWGAARAAGFFVAIFVTCLLLSTVGDWLTTTFAMSEGFGRAFAFLILSAFLVGPAWVFTHKLQGHQKQNWKQKFNTQLAIVPGIFLGVAIGAWFTIFLAIFISKTFPIGDSWIGSRIFQQFPVVQIANQRETPLLDFKDENYYLKK